MTLLMTGADAPWLVVFAHGKESGPQGSKIQRLAEVAKARGAQVLSPDFSDLPHTDNRIERLLGMPIPAHRHLVLVGSSMGGYVVCAASAVLKPAGVFLMAPAIGLQRYSPPIPDIYASELEVVMGWRDEVIPVDGVVAWAGQHRARVHLVDDDHRLSQSLEELAACFDAFLNRLMMKHKDDPAPTNKRPRHTNAVPCYAGRPEELAEAVGDLYYDALAAWLHLLAEKLARDSTADAGRGRHKLAQELAQCSQNLSHAASHIDEAWRLCKPHVDLERKANQP